MDDIWEWMKEPIGDTSFPKALLVLLVVICIACVAGFFYRSERAATAAGVRWERAINIESWQTVREDDWSIPQGGRKVREYMDIHHWETYVSGSHTECSGGIRDRHCTTVFEHDSRPVWWTKYEYEIERWVVVRTPSAAGLDQKPSWPDVSDIRDAHNPPQIGDERPGMRSSRYTVYFTSDKQQYTLDITEERWNHIRVGTPYTLILNIFGNIVNYKDR